MTTIALKPDQSDLSPAQKVLENLLGEGVIASHEQQPHFDINYPQEPQATGTPEIPEVRLWFIRLDARYPWLPFILDWKWGNLSLHRYARANLVAKKASSTIQKPWKFFLMQKLLS